jgi:hypothetical protein
VSGRILAGDGGEKGGGDAGSVCVCTWWNAVSKTATCCACERLACAASIPARAEAASTHQRDDCKRAAAKLGAIAGLTRDVCWIVERGPLHCLADAVHDLNTGETF